MLTSNQNPEHVILKIGRYGFEPKTKSLSIDHQTTKLSNKEAKILEFLVSFMNKTAQRKDMVAAIWGDYDQKKGRSMDVFISKLRKHFDQDSSIQIINVFGKGFSLTVKNDKPLRIFR
jgi:DNA-binding response OmpR family regulator